nr:MAG TPA: hypothetical protein [Caudoviricetes sp.]
MQIDRITIRNRTQVLALYFYSPFYFINSE